VNAPNELYRKRMELATKSLSTNRRDPDVSAQQSIDTIRAGLDKIRRLNLPAREKARVEAMLAPYDRLFADANGMLAAGLGATACSSDAGR
jgi:hypothetical protein